MDRSLELFAFVFNRDTSFLNFLLSLLTRDCSASLPTSSSESESEEESESESSLGSQTSISTERQPLSSTYGSQYFPCNKSDTG